MPVIKIKEKLQNLHMGLLSNPVSPPSPGLYHYLRQGEGEKKRIHLRLDPDGHGTLIVNAARVFHLNPSAAWMAYLILEETPEAEAIHQLASHYRISKARLKQDYTAFLSDLNNLLDPNGPCPVCDLDLEVTAPFSTRPSAPYRMDLALTYRCNNDCSHCYNVSTRDDVELTTQQWKEIIDRLWEISVPHIIFTGGEPTLRDDLAELIAYAEEKGQITGLNTNGRRLSDPHYVASLVTAGLDHVQITLESNDAAIHDQMVQRRGAWQQTVAGLRNALDSPLYVMTNTTMLHDNAPTLGSTLDFLAEIGVPTIGLNALIYAGRGKYVGSGLYEDELPPLLDLARARCNLHGQRLIWYTPTQYCRFDPVQLELGVKSCTAALYNMCVEPDGKVIPCQSYYESVGHMLNDPWEVIWNHPLCLHLRERHYIPEKCTFCALLSECGGGCPLKVSDDN